MAYRQHKDSRPEGTAVTKSSRAAGSGPMTQSSVKSVQSVQSVFWPLKSIARGFCCKLDLNFDNLLGYMIMSSLQY